MLKYKLLQPEMLAALAAAGHNSRVLVADGNFPFSSKLGPRAEPVYLNLMPGVVTCTQVLEALVSAIPVQGAAVMEPAKTGPYAMKDDPPIWAEFREILSQAGAPAELERMDIAAFYEAAMGEDVALTVATGDQRWYSNILLSIGAIQPE